MEKLNMCRICLVENVRMHVVADKKMHELYEKLTDIPFETEDNRPMLACFFCYTKLKQCCLLQQKCHEAEELFAQMMNEPNPSVNRGQPQFLNGFVKTPIENISIIDIGQMESIAIKEEFPAVCERLEDIIEPKEEHLHDELKIEDNGYSDVGDTPLHHSESDSKYDVSLKDFQIEVKVEQVSRKKRRVSDIRSTKMTEQGDPLPSRKRKVLCGYDRNKIKEALEAISNGMPIRAASKLFGVPRTTLQDRLAGRIDIDVFKVGRPSVLNLSEEETLVQWLIQLAKCGFPRKKTDLINSVKKIMKAENRQNPFNNDTPGQKWYELFMQRHPELSQRTPESINTARAIVTEEYIRTWFSDFLDFLTKTNNLDILEDPNRILSGHEISFQICPKTGKVIEPKGWKNIYEVKRGSEKETITVMIVITAAGELVAPMVVLPYVKKPPKEDALNVPPSIILEISESGWMRGDLFHEYIANGVNARLEAKGVKKPVVLFVDGHKSHLTYHLSEFCDANQIILYALPPNTTHILQPADVSVFRPYKSEWRKTTKAWQDEQGKPLTKVTFCPLLQKVLEKDMSQTIKNGFERCGLYPFNPDAVDYSKCGINEIPTIPSSQVEY